MKYAYDILLNFNEDYYDFFEWKDDDLIEYIKKIPIFKISDSDYKNIISNKIKISNEFLSIIYNCAEIYLDKTEKIIEYACLFSSGDDVIAVEFNYKGISIMKSKLLLEENEDILELIDEMKISNIKYDIISLEKKEFNTREEKKNTNFLLRELNILYKDNNTDKLKYLYYECFNKFNNNIDCILNEFKYFIKQNWDNKHKKLYDLLMLTYIKK